MGLELTADDLFILEKHRLERLRCFFAETLTLCFMHLDHQNRLSIHCSEPWVMDELLREIEQLRWYAWIIVGARQLSLCFAQEEIYATNTDQGMRRSRVPW